MGIGIEGGNTVSIRLLSAWTLGCLCFWGGTTLAQAAGPAPAPAPAASSVSGNTLWHWLGIPQGYNKVRDARVNRSGDNPGRERLPPLKRIADPENLYSQNPAIQTAAKIKAEEDLGLVERAFLFFIHDFRAGFHHRAILHLARRLAAIRLATANPRETAASLGGAAHEHPKHDRQN